MAENRAKALEEVLIAIAALEGFRDELGGSTRERVGVALYACRAAREALSPAPGSGEEGTGGMTGSLERRTGAVKGSAPQKALRRHSGVYDIGTRLVHHTGSVWEVTEADLPGDGKTWGEGMILCEGDYRIRCVKAFQQASYDQPGREMRVHRDYLHGDGWRLDSGPKAPERAVSSPINSSRSSSSGGGQ